MRTIRFSIINIFALIFLLSACSTIEDRDTLSNSFDKDNVELEVIQEDGGNKLTLKVKTKGITGFWDYIIDKKYSDQVDVIFPFTGEHTFTFNSTTPYIGESLSDLSYISTEIKVKIDKLDTRLPDAYYHLIGENLEGKTWVFDGELGDNRVWWAMANPGDPNVIWWNAAGMNQGSPTDLTGRMTFDVNGGANYTYYASEDAAAVTGGTFAFNASYTEITINGDAHLLGATANAASAPRTLQILELTDTTLKLFSPSVGETGWVWAFKPMAN